MNLEMASEMENINVENVIVNDDVVVENSTYTIGRRGIAGTVFVHKIAGAAAEKGLELREVKRIAEKTIKNVKTIKQL
ncbi:MAG TPA: dihydroxyacetone kinase subunit DhaK [Tissierellales bacterium]|nr:dihydroxyacetone kinase subunit DhaK [Tissierellales bacterium]